MKTTKIWTWALGAVAALAVADAPDEPSAAVQDEHGGGVTNRLAGTDADIAAVRALYSEEAAAAMADPLFPHVAPQLRDGLNPLAPLAVFDSDALLYYAFSSNLVGNMMLAAHALGLGSCWINRARETFDTEEGKKILTDLGVEGDYIGIGNLIIGHIAGEYPAAAARKENRVYRV